MRSRRGWASSASPCRSTTRSPAIPTWGSGSDGCSASACQRISAGPTSARRSGSSGGAGTSGCPHGSMSTPTSRCAPTASPTLCRPRGARRLAVRHLVRRRVDVRCLGPVSRCADRPGTGWCRSGRETAAGAPASCLSHRGRDGGLGSPAQRDAWWRAAVPQGAGRPERFQPCRPGRRLPSSSGWCWRPERSGARRSFRRSGDGPSSSTR